MATIKIKQVTFPLVDITQPRPQFPDPYTNVVFGGYTDNNLYIWRDGTQIWEIPTQEEILLNVPNYILSKSNTFISKTDSSGNLVDYRFLKQQVFKIEKTDIIFYEMEDFSKEINDYTITMTAPNTLLPNTEYLITK